MKPQATWAIAYILITYRKQISPALRALDTELHRIEEPWDDLEPTPEQRERIRGLANRFRAFAAALDEVSA